MAKNFSYDLSSQIPPDLPRELETARLTLKHSFIQSTLETAAEAEVTHTSEATPASLFIQTLHSALETTVPPSFNAASEEQSLAEKLILALANTSEPTTTFSHPVETVTPESLTGDSPSSELNHDTTLNPLLQALAEGGSEAQQALTNLTANLSPDQVQTFQEALAIGLANFQSSVQLLTSAKAALSQSNAVISGENIFLSSLASDGQALIQQLQASGFMGEERIALMNGMAGGIPLNDAVTMAAQVQNQLAEAKNSVSMRPEQALMDALASGDTSAPILQSLLNDPTGAGTQALLSQLSGGESAETALAAAQQANTLQSNQLDATNVPISPTEQAAQTLADAAGIVSPVSDENAQSLAQALAAGATAEAAQVQIAQTADSLSELATLASVPVNTADQVASALAGDGNVTTSLSAAAGGEQALVEALAAGASSGSALASAQQSLQAQSEQVSTSSTPMSAADQIANALANGETGVAFVTGGEQALVAALATGAPISVALADARQSVQTQVDRKSVV